jgi:hypothetical protein
MARANARGTKRRCQNEACDLPFYDLNRAEYSCPICGTPFDVEAARLAVIAAQNAYPRGRGGRVAPSLTIVADPAPVEAEEVDLVVDAITTPDEPEIAPGADIILEPEDTDEDEPVVAPFPDGVVEE